MRTVVSDRDVIEQEVKPHAKLDKFRHLLVQEVNDKLTNPDRLTTCHCPGCQSEQSSIAFQKFEFTYLLCGECKSVYVSPRPSDEDLVDFYRNSKSWRFWREEILPETREARRTKIFRPRARWLLDVCDEYQPDAQLCIVMGYHNDMLIEELARLENNLFRIIVTNAIADIELANLDLPNVFIRPTSISKHVSLGPADIILAFDILDRCADVNEIFVFAQASLRPGGLLLAGTTLISGFDLQVLWERSDNIHPPERLNLLSVEGMIALYKRHGFEVLEFSTPGNFDFEIVKRAVRSEPDGDWPRFVRYLIENRDSDAFHAFQEFLQAHRLSSFGRIVLRKSV